MFTYGTQVNPSLLRQDFSPILQAAQAQAQATQQAAAIRAQSMANFGQVVSKGIQDFIKKKEEKDLEQKGVEFIKGQIPGIDDKAALAGLKAAGGPAAFVKFQQDMAQNRTQQKVMGLQLGELERGIAEQERLRQALATPPAASAIQAGARFEQLPTGQEAFSAAPQGVEEFLRRAQSAGVSPSIYAQPALQLAQVRETLAQAGERERGKPVPSGTYSSFEDANKRAVELTKSGNLPEGTTVVTRQEGGRFVNETVTVPPRQVADPEAAERIRLSGKLMDADIANGEQARRLLPQTNRMIQSLRSGMKTGKFEAAKTELTSYAKSFGFKVDEEALAEKEQFQAYATQQILGFFQQTKGGVSNKENELFGLMGPGYTRSERANELLLEVIQERQKLDAAIGDNALRAIEEGWSQAKTAAERRKLIEAYDAKLPDPASLNVKQVEQPQPSPQSGTGGQFRVGQRVRQGGTTYEWNGTTMVPVR